MILINVFISCMTGPKNFLYENEASLFGKQLRRSGHKDSDQHPDPLFPPGSRQARQRQFGRLPDECVTVLENLSGSPVGDAFGLSGLVCP